MKQMIFHLCQKGGMKLRATLSPWGMRMAVCALAIGLSTGVYAIPKVGWNMSLAIETK